MDIITLHNSIARRQHILASCLKYKHLHSNLYFLSKLNAGLRKDLMYTKIVDSIHARIKNANHLMIIAYISGEKHLYLLNTESDEIRYQQEGS